MDDMNPLHAWMQSVESQLRAGETRMADFEQKLDNNTALTKEIRDILDAAKGAFKVLGGLGVAAVWVGKIAGAGVAIWGAFYALTHGGRPPGGQ